MWATLRTIETTCGAAVDGSPSAPVMGAINGIRLSLVARQAQGDAGALARLSARSFVISWCTRLAIGVGIVFVMTSKPELAWSILAIAIAAAAGAVAGLVFARPTSPN